MFGRQGGDDLSTDKAAGLDVKGMGADGTPYFAAGVDFDLSGGDAADDDPSHDNVLGRDITAHQSFLVNKDHTGDCEVAFIGPINVQGLVIGVRGLCQGDLRTDHCV